MTVRKFLMETPHCYYTSSFRHTGGVHDTVQMFSKRCLILKNYVRTPEWDVIFPNLTI